MAIAPAVVRGPDIIIRTAPPLSATSDAPLADTPRPPVSASNAAADLERGVPREITLQEKAAAEAARSTEAGVEPADAAAAPDAGEAEGEDAAAAAAKKAADLDAVPDEIEVDGKKVPTPPYAKREITKARNRQREAEAAKVAAETAAKTAQEAAEALQKELAELRAAKVEVPKPAEPVVEAAPDPKPTRETFDDPDAYDTALTEWGVREGERKAAAKLAEEKTAAEAEAARVAAEALRTEQEAQVAKLNADWQTKRTQAVEKYPDYAAVVEAEGLKISDPMAAAIMLAENGTDIAYHLGQNPDDAARIAAMPNPMAQLIEIGRLSATLAAPPRRAPRPRPIEPIDAGAARADTSEVEPDMNTYAERRMAELRKARPPFFGASNMH